MAQKSNGLTNYDRTDYGITEVDRLKTESWDAPHPEKSDESIRLHSEIEETRENMSETIDAIQERLSFSNLSEQVSEQVSNVIETAKDTVYEATIGKMVNYMNQAGNGIMQTPAAGVVKANPIPFALIGVGSAMLIYNAYRKKDTTARVSEYRPTENRTTEEDRSPGLLRGATDAISDKAGSAYETVSRTASSTFNGASDMAHRAYEKVGEVRHSTKENYDHYLQEKPLAIAAAALAVGAVVGLAIPSTSYEGELMGEAKQNLLSKAEGTAGELVDKAKHAASEAGQVISNEFVS